MTKAIITWNPGAALCDTFEALYALLAGMSLMQVIPFQELNVFIHFSSHCQRIGVGNSIHCEPLCEGCGKELKGVLRW